ncbi:hypothetical protein PCANC_05259 [Puccinia coronata f. sp. avenae]|uniref:Uncharacterized protein n=1 Tax=Puccinia coronata f. sp. avenae TaxID=200324 RepID=A0A2N5SCV3_9BASI|nr:hypothetical protein PCANC_21340 [Puccinia coronata f. sp. avenae]PLW55169.1 hypothetical protein PCANC_05259 [Puccinia coronata f. sp. avenae]
MAVPSSLQLVLSFGRRQRQCTHEKKYCGIRFTFFSRAILDLLDRRQCYVGSRGKAGIYVFTLAASPLMAVASKIVLRAYAPVPSEGLPHTPLELEP